MSAHHEASANSHGESILEDLLALYVAAEDRGEPVDRTALLSQHPKFADELAEFFENRDRMAQFARPLRGDHMPSANGTRVRYLGNYEILETIATGGMGVVCKARQTTLNRIVAVKMILAGALANQEAILRFQAEAKAAANLRHPGIVPIYEVGLHEGQHYFSMEYIDGQSLAELQRDKPCSVRQAAEYVRSAAETVHFAHSQGTLHRDIKPSNLLIDQHGRLRITDFGLAKTINDDSDLTNTGQVLGTAAYMPPEQATGKSSLIGPPSDVYALGAVLYELLTGRPPFRGESTIDTLLQVESKEVVSPRLLNATVPRDLETICLKCLEKVPHKRYGTAALLADDLGRHLAGAPILARPVGPLERLCKWARRQPATAGMVAASMVALVAASVIAVALAYSNQLLAALDETNSQKTRVEKLLGEVEESRKMEERLRIEKEGLLEEAVTARLQAREFMYSAHIVLAEQAIDAGDMKHAYELLAPFRSGEPDVRGPMWYRRWREIRGEDWALPTDSELSCVAYSVADDKVVHGGTDGTLAVWNVKSQERLHELHHTAEIRFVDFLPGDQKVVFADERGKLFTWNLDDGHTEPLSFKPPGISSWLWEELCQPAPPRLRPSTLEETTGELFAESNGHRVRAKIKFRHGRATSEFERETADNDASLQQVAGEIQSIAISPSGRFVAVGGIIRQLDGPSGSFVEIHDLVTPGNKKMLECGNALHVASLAFAHDGTQLAACIDSEIRLWNLVPANDLEIEQKASRSTLTFDANNNILATIHRDGVSLRDPVTGIEQRKLPASSSYTYDVTFDRESKRLAVAGQSGVEVWDVQSGQLLRRFEEPRSLRVRFDPAGRFIAASGHGLVVWELKTGAELCRIFPQHREYDNWRSGIAVSPLGNQLAIGTRFDGVQVYDTANWSLLWSFDPGFWIISLAYTPDGEQLIGVGHNPHVWFWVDAGLLSVATPAPMCPLRPVARLPRQSVDDRIAGHPAEPVAEPDCLIRLLPTADGRGDRHQDPLRQVLGIGILQTLAASQSINHRAIDQANSSQASRFAGVRTCTSRLSRVSGNSVTGFSHQIKHRGECILTQKRVDFGGAYFPAPGVFLRPKQVRVVVFT
jgi:eukaryotic-like serine/threonine-protein kinase